MFSNQIFFLKHTLGTCRSFIETPYSGEQKVHQCLMYHSITTEEPKNDIYALSLSKFKMQMQFIKDSKFNVVSFDKANSLAQSHLTITFDDGHKDNFALVKSVMTALDLPWAVFVISDFVDNNPAYLTSAELKELAADPLVTIGAHGKTHNPLTSMGLSEAKDELRLSKLALEKIIQKPVTTMSFPHGAYNQSLINAAIDLGFIKCGTSTPNNNLLDSGIKEQEISRHCIYSCESSTSFKQKLSGQWDWVARRKN
jgi:peptidoglycan/xylan/chitin deacetylase (PgdA/CDA1 family)